MTPEEENLAFHHQIGKAITQWAYVEHGLMIVLHITLGAKQDSGLRILFFSVENFRSKLQVVDNAFRAKITDKDHLAEWQKIQNRLQSLAKGRNRLAHYVCTTYPDAKPGRRFGLGPWLSFSPRYNKAGKLHPPAESLFVKDVSLLERQFSAQACVLWNFADRLGGNPEHLPKSLEQAKSPMSLPELRRQIHELCGSPLRSLRR